MSQAHPRTVVDADGLYWLAEDECCRSGLDSNTILTPHPGEMARLKGIENSKVQEDRSSCLSSATQDLGCTIILKGANTLIQSPGQPIYVSPIACANLAVGGTGDILAGMLGSLCNKALTTLQACCLGVYWHGLAGYLLQEKYPFRGNRPLEIAETLPFVFKEIENDQSR
jgi:NAD(P)H-hydrate epimerase